MNEQCTDNRFEIIAKAKEDILGCTNINTSPEEMKVLDNILFRCWQMGWLDKYNPNAPKEDGIYAEFFAVRHGRRYNVKSISIKEMMKSFTNGLMDCIEQLIGIEDE